MTRTAAVVALAVLIALSLRVVGLEWGLPTPSRYYPYHPDEPLIAVGSLQVDFASLQLKPGLYNYGSLCLYLDRLALNAVATLGWIDMTPAGPAPVAMLVGAAIRVGRWLTVLMGVLTVLATAALVSRLYGSTAGGLAALLLALAPLHLAHGHYCTVDVPAAWWCTLCLLLCAGALTTPGRGALAAAGACAGLAASTKYNAGLVMLAPLYTLAATWHHQKWYASDRAAALLYVPLAAAGAFLLTTPGIFLDTAQFWRDFSYEWWHSGSGHGKVFDHTPPAWLFHLTRSLPDGLGVPLTLAVVIGVAWAVARQRREDGLLLSFVLPYWLLIGSAEVKFSRYLLPILPALLALAARALVGDSSVSNQREDTEIESPGDAGARSEIGGQRPAGTAGPISLSLIQRTVMGVVLLWTAAYGVAMAAVFARADPRDQAAAWIEDERQRGDWVALVGEPWFYSAPLAPGLGCTHALMGVCGAAVPAGILAPRPRQEALSPSQLDAQRPRFLMASEFETMDSLRLRSVMGYSDRTLALLDHLRGRYRLVRTFRNRPALGPLHWYQRSAPVQDLLYPMPDVQVWERR